MSAEVYFATKRIVVHATHKSTDGLGIGGLPARKFDPDVDLELLAQFVRETIAASRAIVPHPTIFTGPRG